MSNFDPTQLHAAPLAESYLAMQADLFGGGSRLEQNFLGDSGIQRAPKFSSSEIDRIKELVKTHLATNAALVSPEARLKIEETALENYHEIADPVLHAQLLSKQGRILSEKTVQEIKTMSLFDFLRRELGSDIYLSDEEEVGHEQICFRIVRPQERRDVGSLHRDRWFWDHFSWPVPDGWGRFKIWVALCGVPEQSGLLLAPGSHLIAAPYTVIDEAGKMAFRPDFDADKLDLQMFTGDIGEPIMFNYNTLHVGSLNRGPICRVSFEITVMFRTT